MKVLALILARGGSKGVPRKNLADVDGKPLIYYTIEPAVRLWRQGILADVVVTTEDSEIANVAKSYKARVPFSRPIELATDQVKSIHAILHAIKFLENKGSRFEAVLGLQPTSPLRTAEDIVNSLEAFEKYNAASLISVYMDNTYNPQVLYYKDGLYGVPMEEGHCQGTRRQDQPPVYVRNGAIYLARVSSIRKHKSMISDKPLLYEMPKERSLNVDTSADLDAVRFAIKASKSSLSL